MKWMLCLFVIVLLATMPAAAAEISGATASQILAELQKMNGELAALKSDVATLKTDMAEVKADVATLKTDMAVVKADVAELKTDFAVMKADMVVMKADIAELKADVAILKTDVAELKTEFAVMKADMGVMKADIAELQGEVKKLQVGVAGTHGDVRGSINIASHLQDRMTSQTNALFLIAGLLVTILLWMLKKQWDERRADRGKMDAQQAEIAALRAENERMKNAGGLVSSSGGRLESE